jgi:hypothetical protein
VLSERNLSGKIKKIFERKSLAETAMHMERYDPKSEAAR